MTVLVVFIISTVIPSGVKAIEFEDIIDIGAAYITHLTSHEMGHQFAAVEVGAKGSDLSILTTSNDNFYLMLSTYKTIPLESTLTYAIAGEKMSGVTFEHALASYREMPTTYNKALMFFTTANFVAYTVIANYMFPDADMYDPNVIRKETGISKEALLGLVLTKSLINVYRIYNEDFNMLPMIETTKNSAALVFKFSF